ncbi:amino acid adenylation domain-containing protein [Streptomyces sp. BI20]|uniref:amino acid adenylation domain-containing protein n=1 Tax=Streptomyces sp. BI20 TaxID=3403460 RepID=UPI003C756CAA
MNSPAWASLTAWQRDIWVANALFPGLPQFNLHVSRRFAGPVDAGALRAAAEAVAARHDALRLEFREVDGVPGQRVGAAAPAVALVDLSQEGPGAVERWVAETAGRPFDLFAGAPVRIAVLVEGPGAVHLCVVAHHLLADAWALNLLLAQVVAVLAGEAPTGVEPSALDALEDEARYRDSAQYEKDRGYFRTALTGVEPALFTRRAGSGERVSARHSFTLPASAAARIRERGQTPFAFLAAVFAVHLARLHRVEDVVLGVPLFNRRGAAQRRTVGQFANTLPLPVRAAGKVPFAELVATVLRDNRELQRHERFPLGEVLREAPAADGARRALFDVTLSYVQWPTGQELAGVAQETTGATRAHDHDVLAVVVNEPADGSDLVVDLDFATDVFDADFPVAAFGRHVRNLVLTALEDPDAPVSALSGPAPAERAALIAEHNRTAVAFPSEATLHGLFLDRAAAVPERAAVTGPGAEERLSYAGLAERSARVAHALTGAGVEPGDRVAVVMERSGALLPALLGVLRAGAAYVPVDPTHPEERVRLLLADSGARVAVTGPGVEPGWGALSEVKVVDAGGELPAAPEGFGEPAGPGSLAYVLYTSGSTGRPKGVMVEHRSVVNRLHWMQRRYPVGPGDVLLQKTPVTFDVSVWELFWWQSAGAELTLLPPGAERDPRALLEAVESRRVTVAHFVPSMLGQFLELLEERPELTARAGSLRRVFCSGEALPAEYVNRFNRVFAAAGVRVPALVNLYGPTEATVDVSYWDCPADPGTPVTRVPIGFPIDNVELHVLDAYGHPQPVGAAGELCVAGVGVARGYLGRPELTAAVFTEHAFTPGARMYRTGDLARRLADGSLEYLGRLDDQVKVRGNRVELGEVEHRLSLVPGVRGAVVLHRVSAGRGDSLVGVAVLVGVYVGDAELDPAEVRAVLARDLPEYMIPARFARVPAIPLSANGKADRRALLAALPERAEPAAGFVAPRDGVESVLAEVWAEVLGLPRVGVHDDWFVLGGDSITMLRARAGAERRGWSVGLSDMTRLPTIAALAPLASPLAELVPEPVDQPFALVTGMDRARLLGAGAVDAVPMTRLELGMLYHGDEEGAERVYKDVFRYRLRAGWDGAALRAAHAALVARHPALRSSFSLGGHTEPLRVVHAGVAGSLELVDLRDEDPAAAEAAVLAHVAERAAFRYDPEVPGLHLTRCHVRGDGTLDLVVSFHHAILDGWSVANLVTELLGDYLALSAGGSLPEHPPLPSPVAHVRRERELLASPEAREFWREALAGAEPTQLDPFTSYEAPGDGAGVVHHVELDAELQASIREFTAEYAVPLRLLLFAAHCLTLRLLSGARDVTTGLVTHGRPEVEHADRLTGLFLNTMPFRLGDGQPDWLSVVREVVERERAAHPFRAYPLSAVQEARGGAPLLDTAFTFVRLHNLESVLDADRLELLDLTTWEETNFGLLVNALVDPRDGSVRLRLNGSGRIYTPAQAALYGEAMAAIVRRITTRPTEDVSFDFLAPAGELPANPTDVPRPVTDRFTETAGRIPDAPAVVFGELTWTYRELDLAARQVTSALLAAGVPAGAGVGIALDRSPEMIATVLGVLRAGAACVPLDVSYPAERIARMIERARPFRVIAHAAHAGLVPDPALLLPVEGLPMPGDPGFAAATEAVEAAGTGIADRTPDLDDLCLILFTSGSSGEPKGVELPHRLWANYTQWQLRAETNAPGARTLQFAPLSFDVSFQEIFSTTACGGTLHLVSEGDRRDPAALLRILDEQGIERWFMPFVALQAVAEASDLLGIRPRALRILISSGEQLRVTDELRRFCAARPTLLENQYGPTETNIAGAHLLSGDPAGWPALPPIGVPIDGAETHVLDGRLRPVPVGVAGELYLGGACLALGYKDRPDLTEERFVPHPSRPGARLYRTGDVARVLPDGTTVWLGRADDQVKVRGFRVEPAEVEIAITSLAEEFPGIRGAAVVAKRRGEGGDSFLVGYLLGEEGAADPTALRGRLRESLPEYMVPAHLVWLERLPMTPSGKRNDAALRALEIEAGPSAESVPPRDALEAGLAGLFGEMLNRPGIGVHDDFFALGGTSLTAMRLIVTIEKRYGVRMPLTAFVAAPTIATLAERLRSGDASAAFDPVVPIRTAPAGAPARRPVFLVHPLGGNVLCYVRLARHLPADQPLYALQAAGAEPGTTPITTLAGLARSYLDAIRRVQPEGPYRIGGWSFGGFVAFEMARELRRTGEAELEQLVLLDSIAPDPGERPEVAELAMMEWFFWELIWVDRGGSAPVDRIPEHLDTEDSRLDYIAERAAEVGIVPAATARTAIRRLFDVYKANWNALREWTPEPEPIDLTLVKATAPLPDVLRPMHGAARTLHDAPANGWATLTSGRIEVVDVPGDHLLLLDEPFVIDVGRTITPVPAGQAADTSEEGTAS